jgi:hypothetical protein
MLAVNTAIVDLETVMDSKQAQESVERDQLWASLRVLRSDIDRLAAGNFEASERQLHIIILLARIVAAEMDFRTRNAGQD